MNEIISTRVKKATFGMIPMRMLALAKFHDMFENFPILNQKQSRKA